VGGADNDVPLNLVLLGPPAAGKGTQAERFAREHGIPKISTGDILRDEVAAKTPLGQQVKAVMDRGELVGDDLIIAIARERLSRPDTERGFVLDGFPRTVAQAEALDRILARRDNLIVVEIRVPDEELVRRVVSRRICATCGRTLSILDASEGDGERCATCGGELITRPDDREPVVRERLKVYWRDTQPMVAYYTSRPNYRVVDGAQSPDRVRGDVIAAVADVLGQKPGGGAAESVEPSREGGKQAGRRPEKNA
jgi:adenylate kinase